MKRMLSVLLIVLALMLASCTGQPVVEEEPPAGEEPAPAESEGVVEDGEEIGAAFVLPGVINDGGFNTQSYQAILAAEEALNLNTTYVEGMGAPTDGAKAIRDYAAEGWDVVWAQGGQFASAVLEIAPSYPDQTFVMLAGPGMELPENVWVSGNDFEDTYFLAGALAGLMTESDTVGYIGGLEIPIYVATGNSFKAGVEYVNPDANVLITFTGDFNDPTAAQEAARGQIEAGVDIIAHALDLGFFGLVDVARETEGQVRIIGKDVDQKNLAPEIILTSVILDYKEQFRRILGEIAAGQKGGYMPMSLPEGTAYLAPFYGEVPDDVISQLEEIEQQLNAGEIEYPTQADLQ